MFRFSAFPSRGSVAARVATGFSGVALAAGLGLLAGCPSQSSQSTSPSPTATAAAIGGSVYGGRQPIAGSTIKVYYAVATGSPAVLIGSTTSDSNGNFTIGSFSPTPPSGAVVYVVASGGDATGTGFDNSAIRLATVAGRYDCGNPAGCVFHDSVNVNELSSVVMAYAFGGFTNLSGGTVNIQTPDNSDSSAVGLNNAARTFNNLVNAGNGTANVPGTSSCPTSGGGSVNCPALRLINTLANVIAVCVNSSSGSASCPDLMAYSSGAPAPGDTFAALHEIVTDASVRNQGGSGSGLWSLSGYALVYAPVLANAPGAWTLALNYTGGGLDGPESLAVDGTGFIYVTNFTGNSLSEFNILGQPVVSAFTGNGLNGPSEVAVDTLDNVWVVNQGGTGLSKFTNNGSPAAGSPYTGGGLDQGYGIAVDSSGNAWVTSSGVNALIEFGPQGSVLSGSGGYTGGGLNSPTDIDFDTPGNAWTVNSSALNGGTISEFDPSGTPLTPSSGYVAGDETQTKAIAVDGNSHVWVGGVTNNALYKFDTSGNLLSPFGGYAGGGLDTPGAIAVDGAGNVWVRSNTMGPDNVSEFRGDNGSALSPASGYTGGGLTSNALSRHSMAVDASGNLWLCNYSNNSLTEFVGIAAPTRTPLVEAHSQGFTP